MSLFEQASRLKLRFGTSKGSLTVEDLWDLPLTSKNGISLDGIAIALYRAVNESQEISFVSAGSSTNKELELKFAIIKHIIETRKQENVDRLDRAERAEKKAQIKNILLRKRNASLEEKSEEELLGLLAGL
jgi:hypothetical protein